jgi:hypothetical protein
MRARDRAAKGMKGAGAAGRKAADEFATAVDGIAHQAIDRILLTGGRVISATEGKRRLAGTEATARRIQWGVMIAGPVVRRLARGTRFTRRPWVRVASSSLSIGTSLRTGVRELQVLTSLLAHRLEESTRRPADPRLVEKLAIDLYLNPKRTLDLSDDRLRLVRLTRKWVLIGALGRTTSKRAAKALDAAERVDSAAVSAQWAARPSRCPPAAEPSPDHHLQVD